MRIQPMRSDRIQLGWLFALIVYTPLPFASNRPWALALLGWLTACLFVWTVWQPGLLVTTWKRAKIPLLVMTGWILLLTLQIIPLPAVLLDVFKSNSTDGFTALHSGTISIDPYSSRLYLAKACILAGIFWLLLTLVNSRRRVERMAMVVVFSGLLQAIVGVLIMATGASFDLFFVHMKEVRAHGTFLSPNHFAGYLEMTLSMGIGLMIAKLDGHVSSNWRERLYNWMSLLLSGKAMLRIALVIMVVGLVASRSRMGNTAFFASLLIVGTLTIIFMNFGSYSNAKSTGLMQSTLIFIVSLILLDVIIIGGVVGLEKVAQRIEHTNLEMRDDFIKTLSNQQVAPESEESVELRTLAARASLGIVRNFPWFGTGGGTFYLAFQHYRPVENYGFYDHAHNDFVEIASETGLSGFLLMAVIVLHSMWQSMKLLMNGREQLSRGMAFASLMGMTSLLLHSMVDFNLQIPANAMLFLILLSLPYLMRVSEKPHISHRSGRNFAKRGNFNENSFQSHDNMIDA
jgi:O-antigen ligase